ncbi:hypothetical protein [uncultured Neglectibacter sp.]|uniref:hypothetical protein n=1 Tax=uncultured Neglectibacter sp. TaxID=1924108 RepID=UPI0034DF0D64
MKKFSIVPIVFLSSAVSPNAQQGRAEKLYPPSKCLFCIQIPGVQCLLCQPLGIFSSGIFAYFQRKTGEKAERIYDSEKFLKNSLHFLWNFSENFGIIFETEAVRTSFLLLNGQFCCHPEVGSSAPVEHF